MSDRRRMDVDEAYAVQSRAAIKGAVQSISAGVVLTTVAHYAWPLFRRQTFQFKVFLVSGCTMFGFVLGADRALLAHEAERRVAENDIRRQARIELGRRGIVPTEAAISKWRADKTTGRILDGN